MTKAPTPTEKSKKQRDNTKTPPKTSIIQRLRTDLGRSVGVTIATQLVWLNRLTGFQPSHSPQQLQSWNEDYKIKTAKLIIYSENKVTKSNFYIISVILDIGFLGNEMSANIMFCT